MTKDTTYIQCLYAAEAGSWANVSEETYLYSHDTQKKYNIIKSIGLPFGPNKRNFAFDEQCEAVFYFPSIDDSNKFDFIESPNKTAFNIYGVDLQNSYEESYRETDIKRFSNLSSFFDSANDTLKAVQYKREENEAIKYIYGNESEQFILSLLEMSIMYDKYDFHDDAINNMVHFMDLFGMTVGRNNWDYALQQRTLAQIYSHAKKYDMSIKTYKESIKLFEELHICDNEYVLALRFIADDYIAIGDRNNALACLKKCVGSRKELGDAEQYINELYNLLLGSRGDNSYALNAIAFVNQEMVNLPTFVDSTGIGLVLIQEQMAQLYSLMENNEDAINHCDEALRILEFNNKKLSESYADILCLKCHCLRSIALEAQSWDDAIITGESAKLIFESLQLQSTKYAELLSELAMIYSDMYNHEKAIQLQMVACDVYEKNSDWISLARCYGSIGELYQRCVDFSNAEVYIQKALIIKR